MTERKQTEAEKVLEWRTSRFEKMGFTSVAARVLAHGNSDLHAVARALSMSGATHPKVYKIFR